jgi:hypothetical protein
VRFRPEDCPAMPARRRTGNENLRKKFSPPPNGRIQLSILLRSCFRRVAASRRLPAKTGQLLYQADRFRAVFLFENQQLVRFHWHALRTRACHPGRADGANESTSTQSPALIGFS